MVKKAGNSYQEKYISNNQKYGKRGRFRRTLGALLLSVAGFGILTGCPPPFNPIPPKTTTTEQTTTPSDPSSSSIVVSSIDFSENEGDPVSYQVQASGGSGALTYSSKNVPSGLSMSSSGLITGIAHSTTQDETDPFTVTVTDSKGNSSSQNATFTDYNKPDFSGTLQSIETSGNQSGFIAVYDQNYNPVPESKVEGATDQTSDGAALVPATSTGFSLRVDGTSKDGLTGILLQGGIGNKITSTIDENKTAVDGSYIATFGFGTADQSKIVLMTSPYPSTSTMLNNSTNWKDISAKDFANFVYYTNKGMVKWNFDNPNIFPIFNGVEISGKFEGGLYEQDQIARILYDSTSQNYIGDTIKSFINSGNQEKYIIRDNLGQSPQHINEAGWIIIEPNNTLYSTLGISGRTTTIPNGSNGYLMSAVIEIDDGSNPTYSIDAHEFLRAFNDILLPPMDNTSVNSTTNPEGYIYPVFINGVAVTGNYSSVITEWMSLIQNPISTQNAQPLDIMQGNITNNKYYPPLIMDSSKVLGLQFGKNSLPYN